MIKISKRDIIAKNIIPVNPRTLDMLVRKIMNSLISLADSSDWDEYIKQGGMQITTSPIKIITVKGNERSIDIGVFFNEKHKGPKGLIFTDGELNTRGKLFINVNPDPYNLLDNQEEAKLQLREILEHELTHSRQFRGKNFDPKNYEVTDEEYYSQPHEVEAYAMGIVKEIKKQMHGKDKSKIESSKEFIDEITFAAPEIIKSLDEKSKKHMYQLVYTQLAKENII